MTNNMISEEFEYGIGTYFGYVYIIRFNCVEPKFKVGKYCSLSSPIFIYLGGNHRTDWVTTFPFPDFNSNAVGRTDASKGDVIIENDVWTGANVTIMSGVTIGNGAVIGANSTVTKSVPPYSIVAGNPARVKKYRFSEEQINRLLKIKWWDFSLDKIERLFPFLLSKHIDVFLMEAEKLL